MTNITFRKTPKLSDELNIQRILEESKFFTKAEVNIAISLIRDKIHRKEKSSYQFIFLEKEFKLLGYSCFGYIEATNNCYDLYWIAVDTSLKRNGYGSLILKETEKTISKQNGHHIYIETSSSDLYEPTRKFYENNGYIKEAELRNFYKENDHKLIYSKII